MALAHTPGNLGKVDSRILQTEAEYLHDGTWQFDVWTSTGQYRTRLAPNHAETEESVCEWGRAVWTDTRWSFWKVA